jgi:hypothetical protein
MLPLIISNPLQCNNLIIEKKLKNLNLYRLDMARIKMLGDFQEDEKIEQKLFLFCKKKKFDKKINVKI